MAELVLIGHRELHAQLTAALDAHADPAEQLAALVRAHVLLHTDYPLLAVVTDSELHALPAELAAPALKLRDACRRLLLDVLERGRRGGTFHVSDPVLAATAIGGMGMRVAHWFGPGQPYTREEAADQYAHFALRIVGAEQP